MNNLTLIGRAERVSLPDLNAKHVPAKIDTGADLSTIWVSHVEEKADGLHCVFFGPESAYYTGQDIVFPPTTYSVTRIANSFGHKEIRYKVKLRVLVKKRLIRATFTLSNRSAKTYPMLLGRRLLRNKFIVDVAQGAPLKELEKIKMELMKQELEKELK